MKLVVVALLFGIAYAQPSLVVRTAGADVPSQRITLQNGFAVCPQDVSSNGITIDCVAPQATGKVQVQVNGVTVRQEGDKPYTMTGDISGVATARNHPSGTVTVGCITANSGSASVSGQFTCTVTSTPSPTSTPTQSPTPSSASIPTSTSTATPTLTPTPTSPSNSIPYMAVRASGSNSAATLIRLNNGFSVCPGDISTSGITLQCVAPGATGQVQMKLNGATFRTQGLAPYTMAGDSNGQSNAWNPPSGPITVGCSTNNIGMVTVSGAFECISAPSVTPSTTPAMAPATTPSAASSTGSGAGGVLDGNLVGFRGLNVKYTNTTNKCFAMSLTGSGPRQFRSLADMPGLYTHMGQVLHDHYFYGIGAMDGVHPKNYASKVCWRYDIRKDEWTRMPDLPEARGAGAAAIVAGRFIVFSGGNIRNPQFPYGAGAVADRADTWYLDLENRDLGWLSLPPIPQKRNHFSGITTCGRTFFLGGQNGDWYKGGNRDNMEEFVPCGDDDGKWFKRANLPYPVGHTSLGVVPYKCGIIVVGGITNSKSDGWGDHLKDIHWYNPSVDRWDIIGTYNSTVTAPICGIYDCNKLICTAGETRKVFAEEVLETTLTEELVKCDSACKAKFSSINVEPANDPEEVAQCIG